MQRTHHWMYAFLLVASSLVSTALAQQPNSSSAESERAAAPHVMHAMRGEETEAERAYHIASMETRMTYGVVYLGLVIFLAMMCYELHQELPRGY